MKTEDSLEQLLVPASKEMVIEVATLCMNNQEMLRELIEIAFSIKKVISWHACWVIEKIARLDKRQLVDYTDLFIKTLPTLQHPSQIRPIFGTIAISEFDCNEHLNLLDFCIEKLKNSKSPYNEKARALMVLEKFIAFEPELKHELFPVIESLLPFAHTAHFLKRLRSFLAL